MRYKELKESTILKMLRTLILHNDYARKSFTKKTNFFHKIISETLITLFTYGMISLIFNNTYKLFKDFLTILKLSVWTFFHGCVNVRSITRKFFKSNVEPS